MTVKGLRERTYDFPDDYEVKIEDPEYWALNWPILQGIEIYEKDKGIYIVPVPF